MEGRALGDPGERHGRRLARWLVSGRVQGVGFRWFVLEAARRSRVRGDVRNLPDGRVEIRVEAMQAELDAFLAQVRSGPPGSRVDRIETAQLEEETVFDGFDVRF